MCVSRVDRVDLEQVTHLGDCIHVFSACADDQRAGLATYVSHVLTWVHPEDEAILGELGDVGPIDREFVGLAILGRVLCAPKKTLECTREGISVVSSVNRCSFFRTAFSCIYEHFHAFNKISLHSMLLHS